MSTGQWQSFEMRMRQRRVDRLLGRADSALTAGHKDEVAEALDEVRRLAAGIERLASIEQAMGAPPSPQEETDLLIVTDGSTIETLAEGETSAGTSSGAAKLALAAGSVLVAAAGLIALSIYTTPAEQLGALFPSLGDVQMSLPAPPDPANARRAGPVGTQPQRSSARVSVETLQVRAFEYFNNPPAAPTATALLAAPSPSAHSDAGSSPSSAPPSQPRPMDASASASPSERAASTSPVLDAVDTALLDARPRAVAAFPLASSAKPEKAVALSMSADYVALRDVLDRYEAAYSRLDATAAQEVWPAVNRSALAGAFDGLASQRLSFERCQVSISGITANANCAGFATWSPKIGNADPRTEARNWTFQFEKTGSDWKIVSARAQNR